MRRWNTTELQVRRVGGCVDFSISEGSSDTPACASAGGNSEIESCATVAL